MRAQALAVLAVLTTAAVLSRAAAQDTARTYVEVPVVVNIQTTADGPVITDAAAEAALQEANKVLAQAGIRLSWKRGAPGRWNVGTTAANAGNGDGNSTMTRDERIAAADAGGNELDTAVGKGKGVKVYFCSSPDASNADNNGIAVHNNRTVFVRPVTQPNPPLPQGYPAPPAKVMTGVALAHELAHAMSLKHGHLIAPGVTADSNGHAPKSLASTYWSNLMFPFRAPGGGGHGKLTPAQSAEIKKRATDWGTPIKQETPTQTPTQTPIKSGGKHDPSGDASGGKKHHDVRSSAMRSAEDDFLATLRLFTGISPHDDGYPEEGDHLRIAFDADGQPFTGVNLPWATGIEREIDVRFHGDGTAPPVIEAVLIDHELAIPEMPVFGFEWDLEHEYGTTVDLDDPVLFRLDVMIETVMLNLGAEIVPVFVASEAVGEGIVDTSSFDYDQALWQRLPVVIPGIAFVPAQAGWALPMPFQAFNLAPDALADVFLGDDLVMAGLPTGPAGTVGGVIDLCGPPPGRAVAGESGFTDVYWLTVRDDVGNEGFTIINVPPAGDGFESYLPGSGLHGQNAWSGWDNDPAFDAPVTDGIAREGAQSVEIEGDADLVYPFCIGGDRLDSFGERMRFSLSAWQYIPADYLSSGGSGTHFIVLSTYEHGGPYEWAVQVRWDPGDGMAKALHGQGADEVMVPFDTDRWVRIEAIVDLEDDWTQVYYDDQLVTEYRWTGGVLGGGNGAPDIAVVDLYANGSGSVFYDDLKLERLPRCNDFGEFDADRDGLLTGEELQKLTDPCSGDTDGDGAGDGEDNCPLTPNPDQSDAD
ncbi:MAG: thrombospondin type 3 repeat-containing protein, partial [Planctomycetota bacterium]